MRVPLPTFVLLAGILAATPVDSYIAHAVFFDNAHLRWIGAQGWWTNEFLHTGGRWAVRALVAAVLLLWLTTWLRPGLGALRRPAAYFIVAAILSIGIVGVLKTVTNVHCPWDLTEFGGQFPFVDLFAARDSALRPGQCFPAAHASSGYALMALYFVLRERNEALGRIGLALGVLTGTIFGIAQQSRGAHFLSHDVWSAFIVWAICASLYTFAFKARLWNGTSDNEAGLKEYDAPVASSPVDADVLGLRHGTRGFARPARE